MPFCTCETPAFFHFLTALLNGVINSHHFLGPAPYQDDSKALQYFSQTPTHLRVVLLRKTMRPFTPQVLSSAESISPKLKPTDLCKTYYLIFNKAQSPFPDLEDRIEAKEQRQNNQKTEVCSLKFLCKPKLLCFFRQKRALCRQHICWLAVGHQPAFDWN